MQFWSENYFSETTHCFSYTVTVKVSEQKPFSIRKNEWCLAVPPRCSKYQIKFKTVYKTEVSGERVQFFAPLSSVISVFHDCGLFADIDEATSRRGMLQRIHVNQCRGQMHTCMFEGVPSWNVRRSGQMQVRVWIWRTDLRYKYAAQFLNIWHFKKFFWEFEIVFKFF